MPVHAQLPLTPAPTYELNPPKIAPSGRFDRRALASDMGEFLGRSARLEGLAGGIHVTDSVLGVPRVSSITAASMIKKKSNGLKLSCSLRTSDRNAITLCQAAADAVMAGIDSLLVLLGDAPTDGRDSGLKPSAAVRMLQELGFDKRIKLDLSFPARVPDKDSPAIRAKLEARPHAFVTQSISSLSDLGGIVDIARPHGIKVIACIMVPAVKNAKSAQMIGLDWSGYEKEPVDFVKQAGRIVGAGGGVLLTSPNSFQSGLELLQELSRCRR